MNKTRLLLLAEALLDSADRHNEAILIIRGSNPVVGTVAGAIGHALVALTCSLIAGGIATFAMAFRLRAVK